MTSVLILPGYGNSGPEHWQSRWEAQEPSFRRVAMPSWDAPEREAWVAALDAAVRAQATPPVVVAHSLGCLALVHWAAANVGALRAALLVAPPDPNGPEFPAQASGFAPLPAQRLAFRSRVLASRNDPYASLRFATECARAWGSELVDIGELGHINADSNLGSWPAGRALLSDLLR